MATKPLAGVTVLDFTGLLPGPQCTLQLADLGADVVKIEPPGAGEAARGPAGGPATAFFALSNRNKRSLSLNLKDPRAQDVVKRLVASADVLVEGFRPGVMARLGLDYATLSAIAPRLVYCSITGYGQTGPLAHKAGHDTNYQGYAAVSAQNVIDGSRPSPGGMPTADLAGGALSASVGILAALFDAQRTGRGRHVDISMTDCLMALNVNPLASRTMAGGRDPTPGQDMLSGGLPCYRTYATADGRHLAVGALEPKFWLAFCQAAGRPDLVQRGWDMSETREQTIADIAAVIGARTLAEWNAVLDGVDACVSPILTLEEALAHPNTRARGMVVEGADGGPQFACPIAMSDFEFTVERPPPALGEHNAEVLGALGYSSEEIAGLAVEGVI